MPEIPLVAKKQQMKKIILLTLTLTLYFFTSYSQDSVKVSISSTQGIMAYNGNGTVYSGSNSANAYHKTAKLIYYKIGEQEWKLFDRNEEKIYKEYISSNESALKCFKIYKAYKIAGFSSIGLFVLAVPVVFISLPAAIIVGGVGLVSLGSCNILQRHAIKKSAKIFNKGLKKGKPLKK